MSLPMSEQEKSISQSDKESNHAVNSNEVSFDENETTGTHTPEKSMWVQCDNPECGKWRRIDHLDKPEDVMGSYWTCRMNEDPRRNNCQASQESDAYEEGDEEVLYSAYHPGMLVWGKVAGYPWWPGLIENCPDHRTYYSFEEKGDRTVVNYHVTFFDVEVTRAWLSEHVIKPLTGKEKIKDMGVMIHRSFDYTSAVLAAYREAKKCLSLTKKERIEIYQFTKRFKGGKKEIESNNHENEIKNSPRNNPEDDANISEIVGEIMKTPQNKREKKRKRNSENTVGKRKSSTDQEKSKSGDKKETKKPKSNSESKAKGKEKSSQNTVSQVTYNQPRLQLENKFPLVQECSENSKTLHDNSGNRDGIREEFLPVAVDGAVCLSASSNRNSTINKSQKQTKISGFELDQDPCRSIETKLRQFGDPNSSTSHDNHACGPQRETYADDGSEIKITRGQEQVSSTDSLAEVSHGNMKSKGSALSTSTVCASQSRKPSVKKNTLLGSAVTSEDSEGKKSSSVSPSEATTAKKGNSKKEGKNTALALQKHPGSAKSVVKHSEDKKKLSVSSVEELPKLEKPNLPDFDVTELLNGKTGGQGSTPVPKKKGFSCPVKKKGKNNVTTAEQKVKLEETFSKDPFNQMQDLVEEQKPASKDSKGVFSEESAPPFSEAETVTEISMGHAGPKRSSYGLSGLDDDYSPEF